MNDIQDVDFDSVSLNSEQFGEFLKCMLNLAEPCTDADIQRGLIRQRSTDNTTIFEIDMTSLINDLTIPLIDLKRKLILLKTFGGQDVTIDRMKDGFSFSDRYSTLKFMNPAVEFMDNTYMKEEERDRIFDISNSDKIMECEMDQSITERIKIITATFNTPVIQAKFKGDTADIQASASSGDQSIKFLRDVNLDAVIENASLNIPTTPFGIEHDTDVLFSMYKEQDKNAVVCVWETTLGEMDINLYTRNSILFK